MRLFIAVLLIGFGSFAHAAEWVQVSQIGNNVREVDVSSIRGGKPVLNFTSRHVIDDTGEFNIGRNAVKYLVMEQQADCDKRSTLMLSSEAQRADGSMISKQSLVAEKPNAVLQGSVDEDILKFVCAR